MPAPVSKTCLVRFDNNKYSVTASAVGRPVGIQAYAERIVIRQVEELLRSIRDPSDAARRTYNPWHYVPVLVRKPGALRNGAPSKDWVLPTAMERIRRKLAGADDSNRQMVDILNAVLTDGLPAVGAACAEAVAHGVHSADVVLNILAPQRHPAPSANILTPGCADVTSCADRRLCPLRQPQENQLLERTQLFDLMGELKLNGMKAAFDEIMATSVNSSTAGRIRSGVCPGPEGRLVPLSNSILSALQHETNAGVAAKFKQWTYPSTRIRHRVGR